MLWIYLARLWFMVVLILCFWIVSWVDAKFDAFDCFRGFCFVILVFDVLGGSAMLEW